MEGSADKFFELSLDLMVIGTKEGRFKRFSRAWIKALGFTEAELFELAAPDMIHPEDLEETVKITRRMFEGREVINFENRYRHKDGSWRWFLWTALFSPEDNLIYGVAKDVTDLKVMEQRLQKSERRLAMAQKIANIGSWELDLSNLENLNSNPLTWSDQAFRIFGYNPGEIEVSNENFFKSVHPDDRERIERAVSEAIRTGQNYDIEHRVVWPDGTERIVHELSQVIFDDESGKPISLAGTVQDITEQKRLLNQLIAAQRIESIGRLSGGIAHDFNNLLAAIYGNLELLEREIGENHKARQYMANIATTARRAADLTGRLLTFSRQKLLTPDVQDLNSLVLEGNTILSRILGEDIEIRLALDEKIGFIEVDASQVIQIVLNLAINARDAMPDGGTLIIETSNVIKDQTAFACLKVTDTGMGIAPDNLEKIFEPFFTTKSPGVGTGLGLSTVYGIVKQSGGSISVASQRGKGTTFEVLFPVTSKIPSAKPATINQDKVEKTLGGQCVLLIEDEDDLRSILQEILEQNGFKVIAANSGKAGLELIQDNFNRIDVMVTDIVLPGRSGFDLMNKMLELRPEIPVICISGYPLKEGGPSFDLSKVTFMPKPFEFQHFLRKLDELVTRAF